MESIHIDTTQAEAKHEAHTYSTRITDMIPSTPCNRICRYNEQFYDGEVCVGCFRDSHEIANWGIFSSTEKMFALEDAVDRLRESRTTSMALEGGILRESIFQAHGSLYATDRKDRRGNRA